MKTKRIKIKTNQVNLFCRVYGKATKKVILVHGGPCLFGYMDSLGKLLASKYEVYEYAQRGTTKTPSKGPYTVAAHVRDLHEVVKYIGDKDNTTIIGHSWGGMLTVSYLAKYQNQVASAIVLGIGPLDMITVAKFYANISGRLSYEIFKKRELLDKKLKTVKQQDLRDKIAQKMQAIIMYVYSYGRDIEKKLKFDIVNEKIMNESSSHVIKDAENGTYIKGLKKIKDSLLVIHGDYDPVPHEGLLPLLKKHVKNVKTKLFKKSGHFCWLEKTSKKETLNLIKKFIG